MDRRYLFQRHLANRRIRRVYQRPLGHRNILFVLLQYPAYIHPILWLQICKEDEVRIGSPNVSFLKLIEPFRLVAYEDMPIRHFMKIAQDNPEPPEKPLRGWKRLNFLWS